MKTPEEIKKAMECCRSVGGCRQCSYSGRNCVEEAAADVLEYIRELEAQNAALLEDLRDADRIDCEHCASYDDAATKERCGDADYLCDKCTRTDCPCRTCRDCSNWEWRGASKRC